MMMPQRLLAHRHLDRAVIIFLSKKGAFKFAQKGTPDYLKLMVKASPRYLACTSVDTIQEAEAIRGIACKWSIFRGYRYVLKVKSEGLYFLAVLEAVEQAGYELEALYQKQFGKAAAK